MPWSTVEALPDALERAVGQTMTFLAENELSALYVPSNFLPRIHPAYAEVAMFLATQLNDEARHIEVFLRRARAGGGGLGVSSVTTSQSLLSLLELSDFTEAAFLLSVLGEGRSRPARAHSLRPTRRRGTRRAGARRTGRSSTRPGPRPPRAEPRSSSTAAWRPPSASAWPRWPGGRSSRAVADVTIRARGADPRGVKGYDAFREPMETMHQNP